MAAICGPLDLSNLSEASAMTSASANARKSVLRQQSYKLAQQTPVMLPPLPSTPGANPPTSNLLSTGSSLETFRPIDLNAELHAHAEEEEENEEDEDLVDTTRPWPRAQELNSWQNLPTTMAECKLTDSNSSLRLSPLLHLHNNPTPSSPFRWVGDSLLPPPPHNPSQFQQERMDTSGP